VAAHFDRHHEAHRAADELKNVSPTAAVRPSFTLIEARSIKILIMV
jgi:hypothetical protein